MVLGLLMVLNTTYFLGLEKTGDAFHFFKLHLCHIAVGLAVLTLLSQFSLRGLRRLVMPLMVVVDRDAVALWIPGLGVMRGGARRWLRLGPLLAEPSELVKFALVFFLAEFLSQRQERMNAFASRAAARFHRGGTDRADDSEAAGLRQHRDDRADAVRDAVRGGRAAEASGRRGRRRAGVLALQAVAKSYRMRRLTTFLDPWQTARGAGFQLIQSFIALGAGGGWGVGLGAGRQKMFYLPAGAHRFRFRGGRRGVRLARRGQS